MYWIVYFGLIIFITSLALNTFFLFHFIWTDRRSLSRRLVQNVAVSLFSILVTLMLLELYFNLFFAQSDAFNHTLAGKNWFKRYWRLNSLGYRDREWPPEAVAGKTKIMALGDSFVAGHGIENPADRFPDVLGQMLGPDYAVMNVGIPGAETKEEFELARKYPYKPDILILSFYVNDIVDTATSMGLSQPLFVKPSPPLVDESYAVNFFYWRVYRLGLQEWSNDYWGWLSGLYQDPGIWRTYRSLLLEIDTFTKNNNIRLIVVIFPNMLAIEDSRPITSRVGDVFLEQGVPVVDVGQLVAGENPKELIASPVDWHANERVHHLVAEELYRIVLDGQQKAHTP